MTFIVIDIENKKTVLDSQGSLFVCPILGSKKSFFSDLINRLLRELHFCNKLSVPFKIILHLCAE